MKKTSPRKLTLSRESIRQLTENALEEAEGGAATGSRWDTCLSCLSCYRTCTC